MLRRLRQDWHRFTALPRSHKRVLIEASSCLPFFWLGVHLLGLARLQSLLRRPVAAACLPASEIQAVSDLVNLAARRSPLPATCLTRSLLLAWLLRRRGVRAELRIGVRIANNGLEAHAWVEFEGRPINDKADIAKDFAPFERLHAVAHFDR
jgi:hypothetical protein